MGIKLKKGLSFIKMINYIMERFPDDYKRIKVEAVKNMNNWIDYCKKEDAAPYIHEEVKIPETKAERREKLRAVWYKYEWMGTFESFLEKCEENDAEEARKEWLQQQIHKKMEDDYEENKWIIGGTLDEYKKRNFEDYIVWCKKNMKMS